MFNGATPSLSRVRQRIMEEARLWEKAGLLKGGTNGIQGEVEVARWEDET